MRSYPWWQKVDTLQGVGAATRPVTITEGAIQWRVKWSCEQGRLVVEAPAQRRRLVDGPCPGSDVGYSTQPGHISLEIGAEGPWQLQVEQQIDVPLVEPPLPAMTAPGTVQVASGSFYNLDQTGRGRVNIYRLADGSHALRLEEFFVTPNVDLEVRLSPLPAPRNTAEYMSAPSALIARLDATAGSMNFGVPPEVDPAVYRSVVIWCPPVLSAYAAATLTPAPPT
ncbi:MAG: DM13 domain-containing protein [Actinomycetota bacterium]|nr:DM13 domain-containing protein [Actinomycetota bacterium]